MSIPQGGKIKNPMSIPIIEPHTPNLDAPYLFAPIVGGHEVLHSGILRDKTGFSGFKLLILIVL